MVTHCTYPYVDSMRPVKAKPPYGLEPQGGVSKHIKLQCFLEQRFGGRLVPFRALAWWFVASSANSR